MGSMVNDDFVIPSAPAFDKAAPVPDPRTAPAVRWGILGAGGIARMFAHAVQHHTAASVAAIGSRDIAKAKSFATDFNVPLAFGSYEELVASEDVDAIYVASPHSHHHEHALLALNAGKPILVEKAFTRNTAEALDIFELAESKNLFAMEAMWTRFLPTTATVHGIIKSGDIGDVVTIIADHGQKLDQDPAGRLLNPALAGGALLDLGVYPVSYAHDFLGVPQSLTVQGHLTDTGVDGHSNLILDYGHKTLAELSTTLWAKTATTAVIAGTQGWIEVPGDFYAGQSPRLHVSEDEVREYESDFPAGHAGMAFEIAEVGRCLDQGRIQSPRLPWQDTVDVLRLLDEARAQVGVVYPGE